MGERGAGGVVHHRSWTHRALEAEGTNVGLFPLEQGRQVPISLPGPSQRGSAAPWWQARGQRTQNPKLSASISSW